jgi:hypothetical protein
MASPNAKVGQGELPRLSNHQMEAKAEHDEDQKKIGDVEDIPGHCERQDDQRNGRQGEQANMHCRHPAARSPARQIGSGSRKHGGCFIGHGFRPS